MTKEERCQFAIKQGFKYNPITGNITGMFGKIINRKQNGYIYLGLNLDKKHYNLFGHIFAWYIMYDEVVNCIDHINGIKDDNSISNLRSVTHQQNHFNRTKAKGCYLDKRTNKWRCQITLNGEAIYLGIFNNEDDAHNAYLEAKKIHHIIKK